jgi:hypothetical protein
MALAFDASSEGNGTSAISFTHTPVGAPKGVAFLVANNGVEEDPTTITYGGVAMSLINEAHRATGEFCNSYIYFLGIGIPTGAQTVVVNTSGGTEAKWVCCVTVTAAKDTELAGIGYRRLNKPKCVNHKYCRSFLWIWSSLQRTRRYCKYYSRFRYDSTARPRFWKSNGFRRK